MLNSKDKLSRAEKSALRKIQNDKSSAPKPARKTSRKRSKSPKHGVSTFAVVLIFVVVLAVIGAFYYFSQRQKQQSNATSINMDSKLSDIDWSGKKVNIFIFRGDGCSHCADLYEYLNEKWPEYSKYANIYSFEVWNNKDNDKIEDWFQDKMGEKVGDRSTPWIIVGDEEMEGFSDDGKAKMDDLIKSEYADRKNVTDFSGVMKLNK